jgi:hypothetical protein
MSDEKRAAIISLLTTAQNLAHDLKDGALMDLIQRAIDAARGEGGTAPLAPS